MAKILYARALTAPAHGKIDAPGRPAWYHGSQPDRARLLYQNTVRPGETDCDQYIARVMRDAPWASDLIPLLRREFHDARARALGMR